MEKLRIHVCGTDIHVTELGDLTTGMVGATASFSFSPEWNGLLKTAVFYGGVKKDVILTGDTVKIPPECLRTSYMTVGVYGHLADGTVVIPTVMSCNIGVSIGTKPSGDTQSGFTPDKWMQLLGMIGDLSQLTAEDKSSLVAAINEVAKKTGGEVDPAEVQRIVEGYLAAHPPTVTDEQIAAAVDNYFTKNPASGLTTAQISALDGLFKIAAYTEDASGAYAAFQTAFGLAGGGEEPDEPEEPEEPDVPVVKTYTVSSELVNVTSNNAATSVNENASYTATLTAAEGYNLDSVTVTMGGVDITATAYADGVITIAAVTGNVEIVASASVAAVEPELPEDGLAGYWDMRNRDESTADAYDWHWAFPCDKGNGLYANIAGGSQGTIAFTSDAYGSKHNFCIQDDATLYPGESAQKAFGNNYTFAILAYGGKIIQGSGSSNSSYFNYIPSYFKLDGSKTNVAVGGIGDKTLSTTYSLCVYVASGETLTLYINGEKMNELNGSDYDDFAKWYDKLSAGTHYSNGKIAAIAAYSKALTETEIVELTAFMKTLEVTA